MASRQSRKARPQVAVDFESEEEEQSSQEAEKQLVAAKNLVSTHKTRRDSKRKAIEGEHEMMTREARAKLDALFENRKMRVTKTQKDLWHRLDILNKKRNKLESKILASMKTIETHNVNISSELLAMLDGRMEEGDPSEMAS